MLPERKYMVAWRPLAARLALMSFLVAGVFALREILPDGRDDNSVSEPTPTYERRDWLDGATSDTKPNHQDLQKLPLSSNP